MVQQSKVCETHNWYLSWGLKDTLTVIAYRKDCVPASDPLGWHSQSFLIHVCGGSLTPLTFILEV